MAASAFVTRDIARSRDAHTPPSPSKRKVEDEPHKRFELCEYLITCFHYVIIHLLSPLS
jgi:hypothetical protein